MLITVFFASVIFELISLTNKGMVARLADRTHLGETDGSLNGIAALGTIIGPILFGFLIDSLSLTKAYIIITSITFLALLIVVKTRKSVAISGVTR